MDDKMSKVVKRVVKELEVALKSEKKVEDFSVSPLQSTPEDYVTCYLSGQIPEGEWQKIISLDKDVMEAWNKHWTT